MGASSGCAGRRIGVGCRASRPRGAPRGQTRSSDPLILRPRNGCLEPRCASSDDCGVIARARAGRAALTGNCSVLPHIAEGAVPQSVEPHRLTSGRTYAAAPMPPHLRRRACADAPTPAAPALAAPAPPRLKRRGQGRMFSRSSSRPGCVGSQPSACLVCALEAGWSMANTGPSGPKFSSGTC